MAAIALNKFRTIRVAITTSNVGIYTCPIGVASIIILAKVVNISSGVSTVTAIHSRPNDTIQTDYIFTNAVPIPPNDGLNLVGDGRMALETNDVIKISATQNNTLNLILSILETAKQ